MSLVAPNDAFDALSAKDQISFWRLPRHQGLECLEATFRSHIFPPHAHETYVIGTVVRGVNIYTHGGEKITAGPGQITFINPGEVHDGAPVGAGYRYRMIYPTKRLIDDMIKEELGSVAGGLMGTCFFRHKLVDDPLAAKLFIEAHFALQSGYRILEGDERLLNLCLLLMTRYGDLVPELPLLGAESTAVSRAKEYLINQLEQRFSLKEVAAYARLSPFHLIRSFSRATGMTPSQWVMNQRIVSACTKLRAGWQVVDVAAHYGFFDQSHFTRSFKARLGLTPAQFKDAH